MIDGGPGDQDFVEDARRRLAARDFAGLRNAVAGILERNGSPVWVASALRWLDAVLAAPLPNAEWAAALVDSIADGHAHPLGSPAECSPREDRGAGGRAHTTADRRGSHIGQADGGAHSGRADAHHRHAG